MVWKAFYQIFPKSLKVTCISCSIMVSLVLAICLLILLTPLLVSRNTIVGKLFFNAVATPESVKNILCQVLPF
jgi:hypothetical protein